MARGIPESVIEEIRSRCDIVDVVGAYVDLKRAGGDSWKALCPFHNEKTPSFHVRGDRQLYHCFGCGKGGNVFRFIMDRENISFVEAAHLLASRCGVVIPVAGDGIDDGRGREAANARERLYALNEEFAVFFEKNLEKHPEWPAARYLVKRQLPAELIRHFRLGAAPDEWDGCLRYGRALGFSEEEMLTGGILRRHEESGRYYDHFKGRLIFPIWNEIGKVVGFSARSLEDNPAAAKYVNTAETPVFKKGRLLYALPFARKPMHDAREAILCEGQFDTIAFHRAGFEQAVAPQGTGFTPDQARILRRAVDRVLIAFDADRAGQKATRTALAVLLPLDFEVRIIRIPAGKDPDALFASAGADGVAAAVRAAVSWIRHLVEELGREYRLDAAGDLARATGEVVELLMLIENPIGRELYIREAAEALHVSEESITAEIARRQQALRRGSAGAIRAEAANPEPFPAIRPAADGGEPAELALFELAFHHESAARLLAGELPPEGLGDSAVAQALNLVIGYAMNGEHAEARTRVGEFLIENPDPRLNRIMMTDCSFEAGSVKKAVRDCLDTLRRNRARRAAAGITERLRAASDPAERMKLLAELMQSASKRVE